MSRNKRVKAAHFGQRWVQAARKVQSIMKAPRLRIAAPAGWKHLATQALAWCGWIAVALTLAWNGASQAQPAQADAGTQTLQAELEALVKAKSAEVSGADPKEAAGAPRIEIVLGQLDPRLRLAPCDKVHAYLPEGARLWGRTRVGLRCERGAVRWNVYWPLTVKVWAPAVVAVASLKPGTVLSAADLRIAETDLASSNSPAVLRPQDVIGRALLRPLEPGQGLRQGDLRTRRWFAAGEPVNVLVKGKGFAVSAVGTALSHGEEGGQCARIRVENGRVLCGQAVAERRAEVTL